MYHDVCAVCAARMSEVARLHVALERTYRRGATHTLMYRCTTVMPASTIDHMSTPLDWASVLGTLRGLLCWYHR